MAWAFLYCFLYDMSELKRFWHVEVIGLGKRFSWFRLLQRAKIRDRRFLFWWRLANHIYCNGGSRGKKLAGQIYFDISRKYNVEIMLGASIGEGLRIAHYNGVVITNKAIIGKNFLVRQNTTIGVSMKKRGGEKVVIGGGLKDQVQHPDKVSPWPHTTNNFAQKSAPALCR